MSISYTIIRNLLETLEEYFAKKELIEIADDIRDIIIYLDEEEKRCKDVGKEFIKTMQNRGTKAPIKRRKLPHHKK